MYMYPSIKALLEYDGQERQNVYLLVNVYIDKQCGPDQTRMNRVNNVILFE